jgi:hypothetical protein
MRKAFFAFALLVLVNPCFARTITVDDDGPADFNNIQAAINDANNGDTIIVQTGTYKGEGNKNIRFMGKAITVRSLDPNAPSVVEATVIDCEAAEEWQPYRGFIFDNNESSDSILEGLTVKNGFVDFVGEEYDGGGAVLCYKSGPTIRSCIFSGNKSYVQGGAIFYNQANVILEGCRFMSNRADGWPRDGGGVSIVDSNGLIFRCNFIANSASLGGGLCVSGNITVSECSFVYNSAAGAAGIAGMGGSIRIEKSEFTENECQGGYGGAIRFFSNVSASVSDCNIYNNYARYGGGIYCDGADLDVSGCYIYRNFSSFGGGIRCEYSNFIIANSSISYNDGGGMYLRGGNITVTKCLIAGNYLDDHGAGIGARYDEGQVNISETIIRDNEGGRGGAIHECNGPITNCVITGNKTNSGISICNGPIVNCFITGNYGTGLYLCYGEISNCTIFGNQYNGLGWCEGSIKNCIIWGNGGVPVEDSSNPIYSCFPGANDVNGNIDVDPCFVNPGYWDGDVWIDGDYHLQSEAGRWDPNSRMWVTDAVTSPCIDAGDPNSDLMGELWPHGKRINMGAYGGTAEASMSLSTAGSITNLDNDPEDTVDIFDIAVFANQWCQQNSPLAADIDRNGGVDFIDFAFLGQDWQP